MATKEPQREPELIIEAAPEPQPAQKAGELPTNEASSADTDEQQPQENAAKKKARKSKDESVLAEMKKQASEDDTPVKGKRRLRDIVGGDFLTTLVRRHIWLILLIVLITTCYIAVRYQCQQDQIDIARLEKETNEMKFKALSSSSNLTIMCRQSHLEELLRANQDSLIKINMQPPFIINTSEK